MYTSNTTNKIVSIFELFRLPTGVNDLYETEGKAKLIDKIDAFVSVGKPVAFSMLGYPFKSMNIRDKVLGKLPDLGELESLMNIDAFAKAVQEVYEPGANMNIISDGLAFAPIHGTSDKEVYQYQEVVKDMSRGMAITWHSLDSFYGSDLTTDERRAKLVEQFGISQLELEHRILMDQDVNELYRGMIIFMNGDLAIKDYPSNSQLQKAAKIAAREMMRVNEAYSALVRAEFGHAIRLSMHKSVNNGTKYSFQLIRSPMVTHSPWHSALLVRKDGLLQSIHRKDAEGKYELVTVNGRPDHYQEL